VTLEAEVRALLDGRAGTWGVYARNLISGEIVAIDADTVMPAQSAVKTCVLLTYEQGVDEGSVDPDRRVVLTAGDVVLGSGVLRYLAPGLAPTLNDLAWLMIIVSDNVATKALIRELGGSEVVNAHTARLGLPTPYVGRPWDEGGGNLELASSPRDLAELYTHLGERSREMLFRHQAVDFLARRVPHSPDVVDFGLTAPLRVYGKAGWGACELVDAARFETDTAAWVVAAMAKDLPDLWHRADFVGPRTLADIGEVLWRDWGAGASAWR
jgi:hypothetical protein